MWRMVCYTHHLHMWLDIPGACGHLKEMPLLVAQADAQSECQKTEEKWAAMKERASERASGNGIRVALVAP